MSVRRALYEYLTEPGDLTGLAAKPFTRVRRINGLDCANRNDARRWLRDRVGDAIYADRTPEGINHLSIEMRSPSSETDYATCGAVDGVLEYVSLTVKAFGGDAPQRVRSVAGLLSLAVSGYHGDYWGETYISECLLESQQSYATAPIDGSDRWTHQVQLDLSIRYLDESTPVYAADELRSEISYVLGDELSLNPGVLIPEGRTLSIVSWSIRSGSSEGSLLFSTTGSPYVAVGAANTTGTKLEPSISVADYSLTGPLYIEFTATDDSGAVTVSEVITQ